MFADCLIKILYPIIGEPPEGGSVQSIKTKLFISCVVGADGLVGVNAQRTT